jgi:hypothetical protein
LESSVGEDLILLGLDSMPEGIAILASWFGLTGLLIAGKLRISPKPGDGHFVVKTSSQV